MQVALDGGERMKELGMSVTYGSFVLMNAVDGMITLGRWDEALEIAEAAEPISRGNGRILANIQLARIQIGNIEAPRGPRQRGHKLDRPNEAQFSGPLAGTRMDLNLQLGDIAAARAIADDVAPILEQTEDRRHSPGSSPARCGSRQRPPNGREPPGTRPRWPRPSGAVRRGTRCSSASTSGPSRTVSRGDPPRAAARRW